jgi:four helix bundle protein
MGLEYDYCYEDHCLVVEESGRKYEIDLKERLLEFSVAIIRFLLLLPYFKEFEVSRNQLSKSATSIGANYEESQAGSFSEFRNRIQICLREARETIYWLKILKRLFKIKDERLKIKNEERFNRELDELINEADQFTRIFGAISAKTYSRSKIKDFKQPSS